MSTGNPPRKKPRGKAGLFVHCRCLIYLLRPEPGPVGVKGDPLGEPLGASVFPDGFVVVLEPLVRPTVEPGGLAIEDPFTDEPAPEVPPVAEEPAEVPPEVPPPAALPLLWASAKVLESASAPANAIVVSFMVVSFVIDEEETNTGDQCSLHTRRRQHCAIGRAEYESAFSRNCGEPADVSVRIWSIAERSNRKPRCAS
jgi:hypothetical protein